jgi:hypothetical protein
MAETIRYAIYTRQSSVSRDCVLSSCDTQFQMCKDAAEAMASSA